MSESMVERVARAICRSVGRDPDAPFRDDRGRELDFPESMRWRAEAVAAIEAMRTLPKDVTDAIYSAGESTFEYDNVGDEFIGKIWAAGIDAALKD